MNRLSLFIIGMPRSGTKLLRTILNNHSNIYIPDVETLFITRILKKYGGKNLSDKDAKEVKQIIQDSLFYFYYFKDRSFDFPTSLSNNETAVSLLDTFFENLSNTQNKKMKIIGDKSPNYIFDIDILSRYYPKAKFIHIIRDPRDIVVSMNNAWNKNVFRSAYRWALGIESFNKANKLNSIEIRYEDLLNNSKDVVKSICYFLNVPFEDKMMKISKSVENYGSAKGMSGILQSNTKKYRDKLTEKQIKLIEGYTFKYLKKYGYSLDSDQIMPISPSGFKLYIWALFDRVNLILFSINEYGLCRGIQKVVKAYRERIK